MTSTYWKSTIRSIKLFRFVFEFIFFSRYCRCHCISNYRVLCSSHNRSLFCPLAMKAKPELLFIFIKWFEFDLDSTIETQTIRWMKPTKIYVLLWESAFVPMMLMTVSSFYWCDANANVYCTKLSVVCVVGNAFIVPFWERPELGRRVDKEHSKRTREISLAFLLFLWFQLNVCKCIQLDDSNNNGTMPTKWKCIWQKNIMCVGCRQHRHRRHLYSNFSILFQKL